MNDIDIARNTTIKDIKDIAKKLKITDECLVLYGNTKAKVDFKKIEASQKGKLILVTAISPTPYGEGKTTVSIGLCDALCQLNENAILALREPSLGPVFGMKGGATGGGYSQIVPMEDINLHFTGDFHAITAANNLLCSAIDNHLYFGNALNIDPNTITFSRCLDINDRALRKVEIGLSSSKEIKREEHFNITAASEIMALFCLAKDEEDLKQRIDDIIIGYTYDNNPVFAKDLNVTGSLMVLLHDAILPNLVQTLEGNTAFVHGGPFANIAHGCNSIIATQTAMKLGDYVITEAGFGSDLGAEKFLDIKCQTGGFTPSAIVLVATLKALKYNAGINKENILKENIDAINLGCANLIAHINNMKSYNIPLVVAINRYSTDTEAEIDAVQAVCREQNVDCVVSTAYENGGKGAIDLALKVKELSEEKTSIKRPYDLTDPIKKKIEKLSTKIYHATSVKYTQDALEKIEKLENTEYAKYPICVAKTQYSLSDDATKLGNPTDYEMLVKDIVLYNGARFITVLLNGILTMPGLSKRPNYEQISVNGGKIEGLF